MGPRERRKRLVAGVVGLGVAGVAAIGLFAFQSPWPWRFLVFPPAWIGALGFLQASQRTCVALAARGVSNFDEGECPLSDPHAAAALKARSGRIIRWATLIAAAATLATLLLP